MKCLSWSLLVALTVALCVVDLSAQMLLSPVADSRSYRHEGIDEGIDHAHLNDTSSVWRWKRVQRNFKHAGQFWDPRTPCGQNVTELMELGGSSDDYLTGMHRVITCDGDSALVNLSQSFAAGLVFAVLGLLFVAPELVARLFTRCRWRRCRTNRRVTARSSCCCVFSECLAVFLLGEFLNIQHEFVTAGRNRDPSTIDLWLVTLGLFVGVSLTSLPICRCVVHYLCSCVTIRWLRRALQRTQTETERQRLEIKTLRAQLAVAEARAHLNQFVRPTEGNSETDGAGQRQGQPELPDQSEDLSDAETDPGYHVFRDGTSPNLLRIRFDTSLPIGVEVLVGGVLSHVSAGSPAADAGVTMRHAITAINDIQIAAATGAASIAQLLSMRPVYVTFVVQHLSRGEHPHPHQLQVEPPPAREPTRTKVYSEF